MISLTVKKIIARVFLVLVLAPSLFMMPIFVGQTSTSEVHAQQASGLITAPKQEIGTWDCVSNLGACIVIMASWTLFIKIPSYLAMIASFVSNTLFAYGLSSATYRDTTGSPFINLGWVVCRDIANTFFIFVLLYIAIMTILGQLSGGTKKLLMTVVVVALFMNFSMYITRFVVDVGNMAAIEFYNAFGDEDGTQGKYSIPFPEIIEQDITAGFLFNIQKQANNVITSLNVDVGSLKANWPWIVFAWFCIGCVLIVFIFVMLAMSFLMVGRVAMIWILMIVSPLAFFSKAVPKFDRYFGEWTNKLIQNTFFPAVFLFFLYLASILTNALTTTLPNTQTSTTGLLFTLMIRAAVAAAFLIYGLKTATGMAGQAGSMASKYLTMGTGAALGVGAWGMRGIAGRSSQYLRDKWEREGTLDQKKTTVFGRMQLATLDKAQNSTFDIRNTGGFQSAAGIAGLSQFGKSTGLTYAQKKQVSDREQDTTFDSLKTKEQKINYINSLINPGVTGKGPMHPIDVDVDARRIMGRMKFNERQELIAEASKLHMPGVERMLKRINADLGETNYSSDSILTQYKALEGDPKKQAEYIASLRNESIDANGNKVRARTDDEIKSVMNNLTETNRAEIEANTGTKEDRKEVEALQEKVSAYETKLKDTNLGADERANIQKDLAEIKGKIKETDYGAIATINREVFNRLKPRQQDLAKQERRNFARDEEFREIKTTLKEKIKAYDASQDPTTKEQIHKETEKLVGQMGDNKIATIDEEDLAHEAVATHLTRNQLEKITRTGNLNKEQWDKVRESVKKGKNQKAKEYLDLVPKSTTDRQAVNEQQNWRPSDNNNDLGDLRN